jgi:hypothetical protein
MALGEFTPEEADDCLETLKEMFNEIPQDKRKEFIKHFHRVGAFLANTKQAILHARQPASGAKLNG